MTVRRVRKVERGRYLVETEAGVFRVERRDDVPGYARGDLVWIIYAPGAPDGPEGYESVHATKKEAVDDVLERVDYAAGKGRL